MQVNAPAPTTVTVIDFDITLACGKEITFTLRPDLGDIENDDPQLYFARTKHFVRLNRAHIAVWSRREREMTLPEPKIDMKAVTLGG